MQAVLLELRRMVERVEITGDLHVITNDPADDMFVECALLGGASVIVSGDRHLLTLTEYEGIQIISAAEFIQRFTQSTATGTGT